MLASLHKLKTTASISLAGSLLGCSAALVPVANDPWLKYLQAMELFKGGRPVPAERLLRESMVGLTQERRYIDLAMVQLEYAEFIGSSYFARTPYFAPQLEALGGSEGLKQEVNRLNHQAELNLIQGLGEPAIEKSVAQKTQALLFLIEANVRQGKSKEACEAVFKAEASYQSAQGTNFQYRIHPPHGSITVHLQKRRQILNCDSPPPA